MKNMKKFNDFDVNEAKKFGELSSMDKKKFYVIDDKIHGPGQYFKNMISGYEKYLSEYKISSDLKEFIV